MKLMLYNDDNIITEQPIIKRHNHPLILMLGADNLIGWKLFSILKRDYQVIGTQENNITKDLVKVDNLDYKNIEANISIYNAKIVIITSESIARYIEYNEKVNKYLKIVQNLVDYCNKYEIKLIFIDVENIVKQASNELVLNGCCNGNDCFTKTRKWIKSLLCKVERCLIVNVSIGYGVDDMISTLDFERVMERLTYEKNNIKLDNCYKFSPVLIDDIALLTKKLININGKIRLEGKNRITLYEWYKLLVNDSESSTMRTIPISEYVKNNFDDEVENYKVMNASNSIIDGIKVVKSQKRCSFNLVYKYSPIDIFENYNVATLRYNMGKKLVESIPKEILNRLDFICPIPNTGTYYAMGLAESLHLPYIQALVKTSQKVRSFQIANADDRKEFLWSKIVPIKDFIKGKIIAIVDEAIFTGTTLKVVCEMLRECGVKEIHICIPTPKCRYHCEYYMHPERPMLLEYIREDMLEEYFDTDSISFQSDDSFVNLLRPLGYMCKQCFMGNDKLLGGIQNE